MDETFHCPSCGAPLRIRNRFVKAVTCDFCQSVSLYDGARLDPTGRTAELATIPSPLYLDATGTIGGRRFRVLGRLVYEYDGGTWQEWYLAFDGEGERVWLEEDEGRFTFYRSMAVPHGQAPPSALRPGDTFRVGDAEATVQEVGEATVVSAEGQLGSQILPGETIRYVDGTRGETEVALEYGEREVEVFVGRALDRDAVVVDPDPFA